jgi:hypothetical protein
MTLLVENEIYRQHIKRAEPIWLETILPQSDSISGKVVLCAKSEGQRSWCCWVVDESFGWWRRRRIEIVRSLAEQSIKYQAMPHPALSLREGWIVGDDIGPDNILCAAAVGPELRRVWFHTRDKQDGLDPGINRRSIRAGRPTSKFTPDPKALVVPWEGGVPTPLYAIAQSEHTRLKG